MSEKSPWTKCIGVSVFLCVALAATRSAWGGPPSGKKPGLHIAQASTVNFRSSSYHVMNDAGGNRWDIQYYGSVYRGTSYAYSGAMYLQINGSNFQTVNRTGWKNKAGDELELGPCTRNGLVIYRRIKVYKDRAMARWLEIIENPTTLPIKVQAAIRTNVRYSVSQSKASSGQRTFGPKDWAIWTKGSSSRSVPTLHVVTTPDAKLRPSVSVQSSQIYVRYNNLTIPAGKTVILCHFESQNRNTGEFEKLFKKFPTRELLKDLPGSVRRMILNMKAGGGVEGVDLERDTKGDRVVLKNGDMMFGTVGNKSFGVSTLLGDMDLPADKLLGMAAGKNGQLRFVMTDGQVIGGTAKGIKLELTLPTGGALSIPIDKITQWSFRISKERPDDLGEIGPYVALDTGDILAVRTTDGALAIRFSTKHGVVDLDPAQLAEITRPDKKNNKPSDSPHVVSFLNGSRLSGSFQGAKVALRLKIGGRKVDVPRDKILLMHFSEDTERDPKATSVRLIGGDELLGGLTDSGYALTTDFGKARIDREKFRTIRFTKAPKGKGPLAAVVEMLNGSVLRGRLDKDKLGFRLGQKPAMTIATSLITAITRPEPEEKRDDKPPKPPAPRPPIPPPGLVPIRRAMELPQLEIRD